MTWRAVQTAVIRRTPWLAGVLCASIAALTWMGYVTIRRWQDSATTMVRHSVDEYADVLVRALRRDMRGAQSTVLQSLTLEQSHAVPDLVDITASAFSRYTYPESFFAWRGSSCADTLLFLHRTERLPAWGRAKGSQAAFPVTIDRVPGVASILCPQFAAAIRDGRPYGIVRLEIDGVSYQIVARLFYLDRLQQQFDGAIGFTVNELWARQYYFSDLMQQVTALTGPHDSLAPTVTDSERAVVVGQGHRSLPQPARGRRTFSNTFFDPELLLTGRPGWAGAWTVDVALTDAGTSLSAINGARAVLGVLGISIAVVTLALVVAVRAARAQHELTEVRAEFVSAVTHHIRTPVTAIRGLCESLAFRWVATDEGRREYAEMAAQEARRLTRLLDTLLAYSRLLTPQEAYRFESLSLAEVIHGVGREFDRQFQQGDVEVEVDVPTTLPQVWGDRTALALVVGNLVDNAIRYSLDPRWLRISASASDTVVSLLVSDHGVGIRNEEIHRVIERSYRGADAKGHGSGLGLTVAARIVSDHRGTLRIDSAPAQGTTVIINLPALDQAYA